ncbi:hypothetical protein OKA04_24185 [Luteolibacter flavescens]|uniref:Uncharacterized protein n=1 Tax=Luteolibacter flavescens TaxID=1859460 RepID=A0ABT3FXX7_9BACT|nr:hypothetical protein [Luteolibacter flavescens]MCW1887860.1 hypothetical protein [Luteolibacter flavescens]
MRVFTVMLLGVNLATVVWLVAGANAQVPPWESAFEETREVLDAPWGKTEDLQTVMGLVRARMDVAEAWTRTAMTEFRRSEGPMLVLTLANIAGLTLLAISQWRRDRRGRYDDEGLDRFADDGPGGGGSGPVL